MALNAGIILAGQQFDLAGAMNAGRDMAMQQKAFDQQNALADLYKTQGANIMAGDQNALAQLAQYDPAGAQSMAYAAEDQQRQRETAKREAVEYAKTISAEQAAAEAAEIERSVKAALAAPTPEAYDAMVTQMGRPELVGTFDNRQALATDYMTVAEVLKMNAPPDPLSTPGKIQADINAGLLPEGTTATPDTVVNVGGEGDEFYKELDKKNAAMFATLQDEGVQAGRTLGMIGRLDELMKTTPTGGVAAFTRLAGEVGIDLGGLGDVQAVQAIINQIVPQQRQPGSGPMSDADLALFKQSVPRLINTPEGNAKIISTMRAISLYVQEQAAIADMVANREITPADGRKRLKALANPLEGFSAGEAEATAKPKGPVVVDGFTIEAIE